MFRKVLSVILCLAAIVLFTAQQTGLLQQEYVRQYKDIAVSEMQRTGVPASITLAQGILESGAGQSMLAVEGNNHFGIKCHSGWTGRTIYADDDLRNECFRAYDAPEDSFRDHSDFLRYRDRYKFLFNFERTDYKSWAYGLKQAGYATDPAYASKLIKCIEDYDLARYDRLTPSEEESLPEPPLQIEQPLAVQPSEAGVNSGIQAPLEQFRFPLSRQLYSQNGVPFVYAMDGETYRSIAKYYHLFLRELLNYNDLKADKPLAPGTVVYLQAKKKAAPAGLELYIVSRDGEQLYDICQRFALKMKAVRKLNGFTEETELREGDEIKLR